MEIRKYIEKIGENKKIEDMQALGDMLAEIIYETKESHPDLYKNYKMELYIMAYGYVLNDEMSKDIVLEMKPYGEHWNKETTTEVKNQYGLKDISDNDFYVVMNSRYNDSKNTIEKFVPEDEQLEMYVNLSKDFIMDEDGKKYKVFKYFTMD